MTWLKLARRGSACGIEGFRFRQLPAYVKSNLDLIGRSWPRCTQKDAHRLFLISTESDLDCSGLSLGTSRRNVCLVALVHGTPGAIYIDRSL